MVQDYTPKINDCVIIKKHKENKTHVVTIKEISGDYITATGNWTAETYKVHKNTIVHIIKKNN